MKKQLQGIALILFAILMMIGYGNKSFFDLDFGWSMIFKIVGIVDDKSDLSVYENMDEQERLNNYELSETLSNNVSKLIYVNSTRFEKLLEGGVSRYIDFNYGEIYVGGISSTKELQLANDFRNYLMTIDPGQEFPLVYKKGGIEQYVSNPSSFSLGKNEILLDESMLSSNIADYEQKIEEGLEIQLKDEQDNVVATLTVVGATKYYGSVVSQETISETLAPIFQGYSLVLSSLNGNETEDKELVEYLENGDGKGTSFVVVNAATGMLDMLSEMLQILTTVFIWVALAFAFFASLLLMNFIATSINYKKREIGVLRALGARGSDIFGIFFNESLIIAIINFALASTATIVGCNVANTAIMNKLNMELTLLNPSIRQVLLILVISIGTAFLSSFLPTFKISRKKPIDAINNR